MKYAIFIIYFILGCIGTNFNLYGQYKDRPNVLFIFIDDLRPELGIYGNSNIHTPNIDKLAIEGSAFMKHYVQVPTCGASRYSILTGMIPHSEDQLNNEVIRNYISNKPEEDKPETFIHHLKRNGYYTVGIGKISHYIDGLYDYNEDSDGAKPELPHSWNKQMFNAGRWKDGWDAFFAYADGSSRITKKGLVKPYESVEVNDNAYPDGLTSELALKEIDSLSNMEQPFFLGVGFFKPHLPFNAPKKYWDLYNEDDIPISKCPNIPLNVNLASLHNNSEFNRYLLGKEKPTLKNPASKNYTKRLTHAYYAAVSYIDAQIGKIILKLEEVGLSDNTLIVLWGDHGWQLGDHRIWGKHTLFEEALHSPLIIKAPSIDLQNTKINKIVSSIDVYPTLVELCQLKLPYNMPGKSLVELMDGTRTLNNRKQVAFSYFNNGISMRVPGYRYTRYFRSEEPKVELYDLVEDPCETTNIASDRPNLAIALEKILQTGNTQLYSKQ